MKILISAVFFLAILSSCKKEVQDTIPDPGPGISEIIVYNSDNKPILTRKGTASFGIFGNGTQIRLDDSDPLQMINTMLDEYFYMLFQPANILTSPVTLNSSGFYGSVVRSWYTDDRNYHTQEGHLNIKEVAVGKIIGEFTVTLVAYNSPNPRWGKRITVKGKFYAVCGGYGC